MKNAMRTPIDEHRFVELAMRPSHITKGPLVAGNISPGSRRAWLGAVAHSYYVTQLTQGQMPFHVLNTPEGQAALRRRRADGWTIAQLCALYDVSGDTVRRRLTT